MALFGKEPVPQRPPVRSEPVTPAVGTSTIGKKLVVDGKIRGSESLTIEGRAMGEINLEADLRVGPTARIEAKVHARNVMVEGTLIGDISADDRVELKPAANVEGNISAPKIVVAEGAIFKGTVDMGGSKSQTKASGSSDSKEKK